MPPPYDIAIVGGGFFGLFLSQHLAKYFSSILLCEERDTFMSQASYVNQARVHNGYHYPRSLLTALRSRAHFSRFCAEFSDAIVSSFQQIYAISNHFSKVSARQFRLFMDRIGAPIEPAPASIRQFFSKDMIEDVFLVQEHAFDSTVLRRMVLHRVAQASVDARLRTRVTHISHRPSGLFDVAVTSDDVAHVFQARRVLLCVYADTNTLLKRSGFPAIPLRHELAELALVTPPPAFTQLGVTVMCGPFFSCMPFPPRGLHSLSHVRYTPHCNWDSDTASACSAPNSASPPPTAFNHMICDAQRFVPALKECIYHESIWAVKTVLPLNDRDDGRPILFRRHHGAQNLHVIVGGKIDNIYDAAAELDSLIASGDC